MNAIPIIVIIYTVLSAIEIFTLREKNQKREIVIFILVMAIAFILSISIAIGKSIPTLNSLVRKLIWPAVKQF